MINVGDVYENRMGGYFVVYDIGHTILCYRTSNKGIIKTCLPKEYFNYFKKVKI